MDASDISRSLSCTLAPELFATVSFANNSWPLSNSGGGIDHNSALGTYERGALDARASGHQSEVFGSGTNFTLLCQGKSLRRRQRLDPESLISVVMGQARLTWSKLSRCSLRDYSLYHFFQFSDSNHFRSARPNFHAASFNRIGPLSLSPFRSRLSLVCPIRKSAAPESNINCSNASFVPVNRFDRVKTA